MSQITYKDKSEKIERKKVYYEGSDELKEGYALCYNYDYGTASDAEIGRAWRVEKPATANLKFFAGVVTEEYHGFVGPGLVEIHVPNQRGQKVKVWTDQNCTLGTTILAPKNASYALGAQTDGYDVARAAQTVNRSLVNGTVLAELYGMTFVQVAIESELTLLQAFRPSIASIHSATQSRVLVLESEVSALQGHQSSATSALSAVSAAVAGLGAAAVGSLASIHSATQSRVLVLESEMSAVQGLATAVDSQLLLIESEVAVCRASEASQASVQSAILVELNAVSLALVGTLASERSQASVQSAIASRVLVLESETSALQGHQASTTSGLSAVSAAVSVNLSKIKSQASAQSQVQSRVLVLESEMSANQGAVTAVDSQLLIIESEVATNLTKINSGASTQSAIQVEVNAVSQAVVAVDSQLLIIESEAATNLTKIGSQASAQSAIASRVLVLESEMSQAKSEVASLGAVLEDFAWQPPINDRVTAPTEVETQGTRYLIIATATGIFATHENKIATALQNNPTLISHWRLDVPVEGWTTYVLDENAWYVYDGTNWNIESINALQSQVLLLESQMSATSGHVISVDSQLLLIESEVATNLAETNSQASVQSAIASRVLVLESEVSAVQGALNEISVTSQYVYSNIGIPSSINVKKTRLTIDGVVYRFVSNISAVA